MTPAPLILTLGLDDATQTHFDNLRGQHFPATLNHLAAHLTLFHHLPFAELPAIEARLRVLALTQAPLPLRVSGLRFLGRGVAYNLENNELQTLHRALQADWQAWLTPQDKQKLNPHITVQNKATPEAARQLLVALQSSFQPFEAQGVGWQLYAYRGGPWEAVASIAFAG